MATATSVYSLCSLALALVFSLAEVNAQRGPVDFYDCRGKQDGNYVHPSDCSKFIACVAGIYAYEMDCVAGLNYDPVNDRCDWPSEVGCIIDPPSTTTTTQATTTTTPTTTPSTTTTTSSTTTPRPTPTATTTTTEASTTQSTTSRRPPVYDCSGLEDGNYKHPTDCSKFIACVAGEYAYEMDCPEGLHYDPSTDKCDYPEVVGCDPNHTTTEGTTTPEATTTTTTTTTEAVSSSTTSPTTRSPPESTTSQVTPIFNCSGIEDGNYKHPTDCSKFISCVAGEYAYEMDCPEGLHYDPRTDQCDYPEVVGCEIDQPTTTEDRTSTTEEGGEISETTEAGTSQITTEQSEATTTPTSSPNSTSTADPDACDHDCQYVGIDCHNYYTCVNFTRKEYHECPRELGLAFNPDRTVCDRIENVPGCREEVTTDLPTTPEEEECGCEYRPHETDCRNYYFCSNACRRSSCELMTCPGDLLWSVDLYGDGSSHQQCTLPERAVCASNDSGSAHLEFSCYKKSDGLYRNQQDCHSYWKCNNGVALLYVCPRSFIYNPEIKSCDFPAKSFRFCNK